MGVMEADEPDDLDKRIERARSKYDRAHAELMGLIHEALDKKRGPSRIARHAGWTREYIAKIRDGKTGRRQRED